MRPLIVKISCSYKSPNFNLFRHMEKGIDNTLNSQDSFQSSIRLFNSKESALPTKMPES